VGKPEQRLETMTDATVIDRIKQDITQNDIVLYMKGTPVFPQCGFSAAVVEVLSELGVKFKGINVLTDPALRDGIKQFSNWPTIPQLYVKGEFVGGCDIVREMHGSGELQEMLSTRGIAVAAE
jgi:monothiol glutaredoxin